MNYYKIVFNYEYASTLISLTWSDILFGINNGFFTDEIAVKKAISEITENDNSSELVMEIASIFKGESIHPYIYELVKDEKEEGNVIRDKFLYLLLNWLFENKDEYPDVSDMIEQIFADFDYPMEISNLVGYLPSSEDIFEPWEDYRRKKWKEYLNKQKIRFSKFG